MRVCGQANCVFLMADRIFASMARRGIPHLARGTFVWDTICLMRTLRGIFLLLSLAGCAASSYNVGTERQETLLISTEREIALGEAVSKQVEKEFNVIRDPKLLEQVDRVGARLVAVTDRKELSYRFTIVEPKEGEDQPNAFALPGGPIYVTGALLKLTHSDDELASVLAHEMGHVTAKHTIKQLQGAMGMQLLQILAVGTGAADARTSAGMDLAFTSLFLEYSQGDELQADRLGVKYAKLAGYNPGAAITFMERLRDHTLKEPSRNFSYFRTHPYFADRIRLLRQESQGHITFDDYINRKQ